MRRYRQRPGWKGRELLVIIHTSHCFLIAIVLGFAASPSFAQQIQGQVRYSDSEQTPIGAIVKCNGTGGYSEQLTDRNGKFYFRVSPGHYTVNVRLPGFREEEQSVDLIDKQQSEYMFFKLRPDPSKSVGTGVKPSVVSADIPSEALKEFEKAESVLSGDKEDRIQQRIAHLEKAVAIYPKFVEAQLALGTTYMDLQQWDKAERSLQSALAINPRVANAFFAIGEIYLHEKKDEEAEKVLLQGLQIEGHSYQGHLTLARVYWDMALKFKEESDSRPFLEKAYEQVKQALSLNQKLAEAHLLRANLLLRVRRAPDALAEFQIYLDLEPKGQFADQARAIIEKIKTALASNAK